MKKHDGEWTIGKNEEVFDSCEYFNTKEEAIEGGREYYEGEGFYVGKVIGMTCGAFLDVDYVLDRIRESAYNEVGEVSDDYLDYVKKEHEQELENELREVINKWARRRGYEPYFYSVENSEYVEGTNDETT